MAGPSRLGSARTWPHLLSSERRCSIRLPYPHPDQSQARLRRFAWLEQPRCRDVGAGIKGSGGTSLAFSKIISAAAAHRCKSYRRRPAGAHRTACDEHELFPEYWRRDSQLGRLYTENADRPAFIDGVVLSDGFWRRTFGGDPNAIVKRIRLDSDLYNRSSRSCRCREFPAPGPLPGEARFDAWTGQVGSRRLPFPAPARRSIRMLPGAMGRLKPGLTLAQAQARLNAFSGQLSRQYPNDYPAPARWALRLVPVEEDLVGSMRTELFVLFGAVAFVLLDLLREPRKFAAGPLGRTSARDRRAARAGSRKSAPDRTVACREHFTLSRLRRRRI